MKPTRRDKETAARLVIHEPFCSIPGDCICVAYKTAKRVAAALADERSRAIAPFLALAVDLEREAQSHDDAEPVSSEGLMRMIFAARSCRDTAIRIRRAAQDAGS